MASFSLSIIFETVNFYFSASELFPIWLFITSGFEHSVANMYYIPAGIMAKANPVFLEQAVKMGAAPEKIALLDWNTFFLNNLVPVTLGNIVGGAFFVGMVYCINPVLVT